MNNLYFKRNECAVLVLCSTSNTLLILYNRRLVVFPVAVFHSVYTQKVYTHAFFKVFVGVELKRLMSTRHFRGRFQSAYYFINNIIIP